jgi:hypothetical protein
MANYDSCFEGEARDQAPAHMACITKYSDAAVVFVGGLENGNGEWIQKSVHLQRPVYRVDWRPIERRLLMATFYLSSWAKGSNIDSSSLNLCNVVVN